MLVGRFLKRRSERRRAPRIRGEDLVAYYWTGAVPDPRKVPEVGLYGASIAAPESFYPGTLMQIVLEDRAANPNDGEDNPHTCVYARVVRRTGDGFCVAFLFSETAERRRLRHFLDHLIRYVPKPPKGGTKADASDELAGPEDQDPAEESTGQGGAPEPAEGPVTAAGPAGETGDATAELRISQRQKKQRAL
jgi:hypothetical protein